ncbi:hypothetical protein, partial [Vibrio tubiashii]|uniref:hypothetical protein n=1 Tax=Vibrio tubiashii TaxID=29498 RepID=UPI0019D6B015
ASAEMLRLFFVCELQSKAADSATTKDARVSSSSLSILGIFESLSRNAEAFFVFVSNQSSGFRHYQRRACRELECQPSRIFPPCHIQGSSRNAGAFLFF